MITLLSCFFAVFDTKSSESSSDSDSDDDDDDDNDVDDDDDVTNVGQKIPYEEEKKTDYEKKEGKINEHGTQSINKLH